jgi:hypothetical protein
MLGAEEAQRGHISDKCSNNCEEAKSARPRHRRKPRQERGPLTGLGASTRMRVSLGGSPSQNYSASDEPPDASEPIHGRRTKLMLFAAQLDAQPRLVASRASVAAASSSCCRRGRQGDSLVFERV